MSKEEFILKSNKIHKNRYDYSLVEYINSTTLVSIIYNRLVYKQTPTNHLRGYCPEKNIIKMDTKSFINRSIEVHGDKYDYTKVEYENRYKKVIIILNNKKYYQTPDDHLRGCEPENKNTKKTTEEFINQSKSIHGENTYDYSLTKYVDKLTKVKIISNSEIFDILPRYHLKYGIIINKSRGETKIKKYLISNNIDYTQQHSFFECKSSKKLRFDFFLPKHNICIEYDGIQHHKPIEYFGGVNSFNIQKEKDIIKNEYCKSKNIDLIRIPYFEYNNIDTILGVLH